MDSGKRSTWDGNFRRHSEFEGKHAVLSASKNSWLNYTDERLFEFVDDLHAARRGSEFHELAARAIKLGQKFPNTSQTVNLYVNDCIGYRMTPEQILFYSPWAFGTADAISFRDKTLRIFDLKTGKNKVKGTQLVVYAAFFCLEYKIRPYEIAFDLRIYQLDEIFHIEVDPEDVAHVMSRLEELSSLITTRMEEV